MNDKVIKELDKEIEGLKTQRNRIDEKISNATKARSLLRSVMAGTPGRPKNSVNSPRGQNLQRVQEAFAKRGKATLQEIVADTGMELYAVRHASNMMREAENPTLKQAGTVLPNNTKVWEYLGESLAQETVPQAQGNENNSHAQTEEQQESAQVINVIG